MTRRTRASCINAAEIPIKLPDRRHKSEAEKVGKLEEETALCVDIFAAPVHEIPPGPRLQRDVPSPDCGFTAEA